MSEPDVTLTDYALAVECAVLAAFLGFMPTQWKGFRCASVLFFVFLGLAAGAGGTVHGYCIDKQSPHCQLLWKLTLQLTGLAASSTWVLGAGLLAPGRSGQWLTLMALPQILLFTILVFLITQEFWIVFTIYPQAALLLLCGFCRAAWHHGQRFLFVGVLGMLLSLLSCLLQFLKIGIDPRYFNHNALAHAVQAVALVLLFLGIRHALRSEFLKSWTERANTLSLPAP